MSSIDRSDSVRSLRSQGGGVTQSLTFLPRLSINRNVGRRWSSATLQGIDLGDDDEGRGQQGRWAGEGGKPSNGPRKGKPRWRAAGVVGKAKRVFKRKKSRDDDDQFQRSNISNISDGWDGSFLASEGGDDRNGGGGEEEDIAWDLRTCIDVIETIRGSDSVALTPRQLEAISNLRDASSSLVQQRRPSVIDSARRLSAASQRSSVRTVPRRDAFLVGRSGVNSLLSSEINRCFLEVEKDSDMDMNRNVASVLGIFGGHIFQTRLDKLTAARILATAEEESSSDDDEAKQRRGRRPNTIIRQSQVSNAESIDVDCLESSDHVHSSLRRRSSDRRPAEAGFDPLCLKDHESLSYLFDISEAKPSRVYCPPEWNALTKRARTDLTKLLSWENLCRWDFNILDVTEASTDFLHSDSCVEHVEDKKASPLLLVGWAILCSPNAQDAMKGSLGDHYDDEEEGLDESEEYSRRNSFPYYFVDDLDVEPERVCNYLREIEGRYRPDLPYHNNVHAADVTQTLHCLLQLMGQDRLTALYEPADLFAALLAAAFHDVGHPGANNLYQKNATTPLAIRYNDASILENMHCAVACSLLVGEERREEWDVLAAWDRERRGRARTVMIDAVLATDMSRHFEAVGELGRLVEKLRTADGPGGEGGTPRGILETLADAAMEVRNGGEVPLQKECQAMGPFLLKFLLHAADISNPAKGCVLMKFWAEMALTEFFNQGDREEEEKLPISPLCDRRNTKKADSQIGFLKFVIRPCYVLLGEVLPRVREEIVPIIDANIDYWTTEKARMSASHPVGNGPGAMSPPKTIRLKDRDSICEETADDLDEEGGGEGMKTSADVADDKAADAGEGSFGGDGESANGCSPTDVEKDVVEGAGTGIGGIGISESEAAKGHGPISDGGSSGDVAKGGIPTEAEKDSGDGGNAAKGCIPTQSEKDDVEGGAGTSEEGRGGPEGDAAKGHDRIEPEKGCKDG